MKSYHFTAILDITGINPFVFIPEEILNSIFLHAGKTKGPIPVSGKINQKDFKQTLVKFAGHYRLYINLKMLQNSPKRIGEELEIEITFDPEDRSIPMPEKLQLALDENPEAKKVFETLTPSLQSEIIRYIARLKTDDSVEKNIKRAVAFLLGNGSFIGRNNP
jgi:hypothetical protein